MKLGRGTLFLIEGMRCNNISGQLIPELIFSTFDIRRSKKLTGICKKYGNQKKVTESKVSQ